MEEVIPASVYRISRLQFIGREYLFRTINLYSPDDVVQEFWIKRMSGRDIRDEKLIVHAFFGFIETCVRLAKKRLAITSQDAFSSYVNETNDSLFAYLDRRRKR